MRNLGWHNFFDRARKNTDFRRYHMYGDVWTPKDLHQGDIVRCDLPTYIDAQNPDEICARNCLVLGVDINQETLEAQSVRLVRFSYFTLHHDDRCELLFDPALPEMRCKLTGFRDQVVLRTGRVEVVPIDSAYFGFKMDRIGHADSSLFKSIDAAQKRGYALGGYASRLRRHGEADLSQTVLTPGLDPALYNKSFNFTMPYALGGDYFSLDTATKQDFVHNLAGQRLIMEVARVIQMERERSMRTGIAIRKEEHQNTLKALIQVLRRNSKIHDPSERTARLVEKASASLAEIEQSYNEDIQLNPDTAGMKLADIPDYRSLLRQHFGLDTPQQKRAIDVKAIFAAQSIDPQSLKDLQTLGIGGLMREPTIQLPEHIWQGRYLMMRIADLHDPANMGQAFRPCAIWKAYARMNDEGQPVLAGFELHPCTRSGAGDSLFRLKVRPLESQNLRPSFLLADMLIRAPLDAIHFQPDQREDFYYELLPHMVKELEIKRGLAQEHARGIRIFGLQDIPPDWVEIDLPPPPNEKLRQRLINWNKARFVTSQAPDLRPMGGTRRTARNYRFQRPASHVIRPA